MAIAGLGWICSAEGRFALATSPVCVEAWFRAELPRLNGAVLSGAAPRTAVADAMVALLKDLPSPTALTVQEAQRLVIGLGLAGASVARHYQEHDQRCRQRPEHAFDGLLAGPELLPFRGYFAALAERTGTGHCGRDTYASLVLWNVPTTEVRFEGRTLTTLAGVTDGDVLSYTGDPCEPWFFELVKRGQTLEAAVNAVLEPLVEGADRDLMSAEGVRRVRLAVVLLEALRRLFLDFADPAVPGRGMQPRYFMDVFRQFAAHWVPGDIPPSGALDADALKRDFVLGTFDEHYRQHVELIMPALLAGERADLRRRMGQRSLPDRLLATLDLDPGVLAALSPERLRALTAAYPAFGPWYRMLSGHARAAGAHLMLSKRFLFNPQRRRDEEGLGDRQLVSNRRGTTGMDESMLGRLARMRREHSLAEFRRTPLAGSESVAHDRVEGVELLPEFAMSVAPAGPARSAGLPRARSRLTRHRTAGDR